MWEREEEGRGSGKETLAEREREKRQEVNSHTEERGTEDAGAIPPPPLHIERTATEREGGTEGSSSLSVFSSPPPPPPPLPQVKREGGWLAG